MLAQPLDIEESQTIERNKAVRLRFWAHDRSNGELLQYGEDLRYLQGGYGGVFPKVEQALLGKSCGGRVEVALDPEDSYGQRDPSLIITQPRASIPIEGQELGMTLDGEAPDGSSAPFVVIAMDEDSITLDGNHPWAGRGLDFVFEIMEIRDSTESEQKAGYPFF